MSANAITTLPFTRDPSIHIRALTTLDEYHQAEVAQRELWELHDDVQIVPLHVLLTAQKNGGLVAGAFQSDPASAQGERMIGFLFGFPGLTKGGVIKHCSHLMCIQPDLRRAGIGEALKRFQFEYVRAQGNVSLIGWTFDPLEAVNAMLNIGKLRGVVRSYSRNIYGLMNDGLNAGLPSDRLNVEWWVDRVDLLTPPPIHPNREKLIEGGALAINLAASIGDRPEPGDLPLTWDRLPETVLVEIPAEMQAIKRASIDLALRWRLNVRAAFEQLFAQDYVITDFIAERIAPKTLPTRDFYILRRDVALPQI